MTHSWKEHHIQQHVDILWVLKRFKSEMYKQYIYWLMQQNISFEIIYNSIIIARGIRCITGSSISDHRYYMKIFITRQNVNVYINVSLYIISQKIILKDPQVIKYVLVSYIISAYVNICVYIYVWENIFSVVVNDRFYQSSLSDFQNKKFHEFFLSFVLFFFFMSFQIQSLIIQNQFQSIHHILHPMYTNIFATIHTFVHKYIWI